MERLVATFIFSSLCFGGVFFEINGYRLSVDRVASISAFLYIIVWLVVSVAYIQRESLNIINFYFAFLIICAISNLVNGSFIKLFGGFSLYFLAMTSFVYASINYKNFKFEPLTRLLLIFMGVGGLVAPFFDGVLGFSLLDETGRVKFFSLEANIFASTIGYLLILRLPYLKFDVLNIFIVLTSMISLLLAYSRAPLLLIFPIIFLYMWMNRQRESGVEFYVLGAAAMLLPISAYFGLQEYLLDFYGQKFDRDDSISSRFNVLEFAVEGIKSNFILGSGTLSFSQRSDLDFLLAINGSESMYDAWIWQIGYAIMYDTGLVGVVLFSVVVFSMIKKFMRCKTDSGVINKVNYAIWLAFIYILLCSQFTTLHITLLFGLSMGLVNAISSFDQKI